MYLDDKDIKALKVVLKSYKPKNIRSTGKKARAIKRLNRTIQHNQVRIIKQRKIINKMFDDK